MTDKRLLLQSVAACLLAGAVCPAQAPRAADAPLPEVTALLRDVEANQRRAEAVKKDYLYHGDSRLDRLNGSGAVKQTDTDSYEVFWVGGVQVVRKLAHNGKSLAGDELRKENERIDKEVEQAKKRREKADADGKETDSQGHAMVTLSRMLELGRFSNPRRIQVAGRDTILIDFVGDPQAKTHSPAESMIHDVVGVVAIDEQDKSVQHLEGHFINNFHLGAGLVASVDKNFQFAVTNQRVNDEVWLPAEVTASGKARFLLFFSVDGRLEAHMSGYRKFKASSTILPAVTPVDGAEPEQVPPR